jgi:hypothetical protein
MIEKQWFGCFVSWSSELWPDNSIMNPQEDTCSTALKPKTSLLYDLESVDFLQNHPKSFMGCIKIICDDWKAMVWLFCQLVFWIMTRKQHHESSPSHIFHSTQAKNQPASWQVHWLSLKPSQIIHGMNQDHLWWLRSNRLAVLSVGPMNILASRKQKETAWIKPHVPQHSSQNPTYRMIKISLIPFGKLFLSSHLLSNCTQSFIVPNANFLLLVLPPFTSQ